jgi:hypothetical protein
MKINVGTMDRVLRIGVGAVLIRPGGRRRVGVPRLTGLFRFCPAYGLFGLSTCVLERR